MSKSNFEVLNDNREKTLAFAKGVDGTPPVKIDIEARKKEAQQLFIDGDLSGAIKKLDQIKDNQEETKILFTLDQIKDNQGNKNTIYT